MGEYPESVASTYDLLIQTSGQMVQIGNNIQPEKRVQISPRAMCAQRCQKNQGKGNENNKNINNYGLKTFPGRDVHTI